MKFCGTYQILIGIFPEICPGLVLRTGLGFNGIW